MGETVVLTMTIAKLPSSDLPVSIHISISHCRLLQPASTYQHPGAHFLGTYKCVDASGNYVVTWPFPAQVLGLKCLFLFPDLSRIQSLSHWIVANIGLSNRNHLIILPQVLCLFPLLCPMVSFYLLVPFPVRFHLLISPLHLVMQSWLIVYA